MGMNYSGNPFVFLVDTLFGLYILAVMLRFLLQWVRAGFNNPISQFLVKITQQPLRVFRRFIPPVGQIDFASIVLLLCLQMITGLLIFSLQGIGIDPISLLFWSLAELLGLMANIFVVAIIIQVVMSWVNPSSYNYATSLLYSLTDPLLNWVRGFLPAMGGLDFSSLVVLIGLQFLKMTVLPPLYQLVGMSLF
jgi:YggT family protein